MSDRPTIILKSEIGTLNVRILDLDEIHVEPADKETGVVVNRIPYHISVSVHRNCDTCNGKCKDTWSIKYGYMYVSRKDRFTDRDPTPAAREKIKRVILATITAWEANPEIKPLFADARKAMIASYVRMRESEIEDHTQEIEALKHEIDLLETGTWPLPERKKGRR